MTKYLAAIVAAFALSLPVSAMAGESAEASAQGVAMTPLSEVLDSVRLRTGRAFVLDTRVSDQVATGQLPSAEIDYHRLLVILRNNGLAAVRVGDVTTIVPVDIVRQFPLPVFHEDDESIDDEEWITRVLKVDRAEATALIPLVRPLLPREGHIAAHADSNVITIVDRAGNVRRVVELIRTLDRETASR